VCDARPTLPNLSPCVGEKERERERKWERKRVRARERKAERAGERASERWWVDFRNGRCFSVQPWDQGKMSGLTVIRNLNH